MNALQEKNIPSGLICLAAILRNEEKFLDEWLIYHRMIGIDHFYLYDDDESLPLEKFLEPHLEYVTVIPWFTGHESLPGRNRQTKAYDHAVMNFGAAYEWITFVDGDEFIVIEEHQQLKDFLSLFPTAGSIRLSWYVFGHNGYYEDPEGLITSSLIRRMEKPSIRFKSITRTKYIESIYSVHKCNTTIGKPTFEAFVSGPGNTKKLIAHINHYQCRSFLNWMSRATRGNTHGEEEGEKWKGDNDMCLRQFVTTVALNKNEFIDPFMLNYKERITIGKEAIARDKAKK